MANPEENNFEEALLILIAAWSGLVVGTNLSKGKLMEKLVPCGSISLENEIPNEDTPEGLRAYNAVFNCKYNARDSARAMISKIKQNLVKYKQDIDIGAGVIVKLHQVRLRGGEALYEDTDNGVRVWIGVLNLICKFNPGT